MELKYEFYINSTPEKVWHTLISPEGTRSTFAGSIIRSTFKPGDAYEYVGPGTDSEETVHVYGTILEFEPNHRFSFSEHPGPSYSSDHENLETRVTYILEPVGHCTKLTLINDQWPPHHPSYDRTKAQWWMILSNIKTFTETGKTIDFGW